MQQCWNEDPDQRPSFSQIKTYLDGHLSGGDGENGTNCEADEVQAIDMPVAERQMNDYTSLRHSIPAYSRSLPPLSSETQGSDISTA